MSDWDDIKKAIISYDCDEFRRTQLLETWEQARHATAPSSKLIEEIVAHWRSKRDRRRLRLETNTPEYKKIQALLRMGYSVPELKLAIDGAHITPHNCGHNDRGQEYLGLGVIFRDTGQVERFMQNAREPQRLQQANQRLRTNTATAEQWMRRRREPS